MWNCYENCSVSFLDFFLTFFCLVSLFSSPFWFLCLKKMASSFASVSASPTTTSAASQKTRARAAEPEVHFIGEIIGATELHVSNAFCRFSFESGSAWELVGGCSAKGQTQVDFPTVSCCFSLVAMHFSFSCLWWQDGSLFIWNHPFDLHYYTHASQEWPHLILEVWSLGENSQKNLGVCAFCAVGREDGGKVCIWSVFLCAPLFPFSVTLHFPFPCFSLFSWLWFSWSADADRRCPWAWMSHLETCWWQRGRNEEYDRSVMLSFLCYRSLSLTATVLSLLLSSSSRLLLCLSLHLLILLPLVFLCVEAFSHRMTDDFFIQCVWWIISACFVFAWLPRFLFLKVVLPLLLMIYIFLLLSSFFLPLHCAFVLMSPSFSLCHFVLLALVPEFFLDETPRIVDSRCVVQNAAVRHTRKNQHKERNTQLYEEEGRMRCFFWQVNIFSFFSRLYSFLAELLLSKLPGKEAKAHKELFADSIRTSTSRKRKKE